MFWKRWQTPSEYNLLGDSTTSPSMENKSLPLYRGGSVSSRQTTKLLLLGAIILSGAGLIAIAHQRELDFSSLSALSNSIQTSTQSGRPEALQICEGPTLKITTEADREHVVLPNDVSTWQAPTPALPLEATLEDRLAAWNSTPISTATNWLKFNSDTCRPSITDVNKLWGFVAPIEIPNGPWSKWWKNPVEVAKLRQEMFNYLLDTQDAGRFNASYHGKGRGIVFAAGNLDTFFRVATTLRLLRRHLNTTMPAEIFSFPGETAPAELAAEFKELGATLRTASSLHKDPARTKNWHIKATALLESSFQEVLYLDSDNMPAVSLEGPDSVFEAPAFKRLGLMFWPDYWKDVAHNPVWQIIGVQCRNEWEQEAGQILIDKARHLDVLRLTEYMLLRYKTWFVLSDGDKDLFRYATLALRKRWAVPGAFVGSSSWSPERPNEYCSHTMLQHDHLGRPAFVHANMLKKLPWTLPFSSNSKATSIWGFSKKADLITTEDLDCDHFANTDRRGNSIKLPPSPAVRRRAALEKGLRSWFKATREYSSCVDQRWDDPRSEDERLLIKYESNMGPSGEEDVVWENPMIEHIWEQDPVLKDFETNFWKVGGKTAGVGFG